MDNQKRLIKPMLKKFSDLSISESTELNKRGISIGQRKGFRFTPEALLEALGIDLNQLK